MEPTKLDEYFIISDETGKYLLETFTKELPPYFGDNYNSTKRFVSIEDAMKFLQDPYCTNKYPDYFAETKIKKVVVFIS